MRRPWVRVSIVSVLGVAPTMAWAAPPLPTGEEPAPESTAAATPSADEASPPAGEGAAAEEAASAEFEAEVEAATDAEVFDATGTPLSDESRELELDDESALPPVDAIEPEPEPALTKEPGMVRGRREPLMPTGRGGIGHFYTTLPDVGGRFTFRFRASTDFFRRQGFLYEGPNGPDQHARVRGMLSVGFTPFKWGEIFASVTASANRNERDQVTPRTDLVTMFALGDLDLGFKGAYRFRRGVALGGQLGIGFLANDDRLFTSNVNVWFDALFAIDTRYVNARQFPFRFAANLGWIYDSSLNIGPYEELDPIGREVARFSLGANHSRVRMRYAADFPIRLGKERQFGIDPIIEWSWDVTTAGDNRFARPEEEPRPAPRSSQWLTLGLRANVFAGLHLDAAFDIGMATPDHEYGPPVPPWQVIFGLGWSFDPKPVEKRVEVEVPSTTPAPIPEGRIIGRVLDPAGAPIPDAYIKFPELTSGIVVTDSSGGFVSYAFPPGLVSVQVLLEGQVVKETQAEVVNAEDTELTIQLDTMPAPPTGLVRGMIRNDAGQGLQARIHIVGQGVDEGFNSDASGVILLELYVGSYRGTLSAEGYVDKTITFEVSDDGETPLDEILTLDKPPETPLVTGAGRRIQLAKGIRYQGDDVAESSHELLDQVAAFLQYHREIEEIRIEVDTDDRGAAEARSQSRADAVKAYLVNKGVSPSRIAAEGYGAKRPVAVNLTTAGRAKNNRTGIVVVRRAGGDQGSP